MFIFPKPLAGTVKISALIGLETEQALIALHPGFPGDEGWKDLRGNFVTRPRSCKLKSVTPYFFITPVAFTLRTYRLSQLHKLVLAVLEKGWWTCRHMLHNRQFCHSFLNMVWEAVKERDKLGQVVVGGNCCAPWPSSCHEAR